MRRMPNSLPRADKHALKSLPALLEHYFDRCIKYKMRVSLLPLQRPYPGVRELSRHLYRQTHASPSPYSGPDTGCPSLHFSLAANSANSYK